MSSYPKFAVVGHPNKGKSSIVSTLAMDESVAISNIPGTTTKHRAYPLKIDNEIIYELYDTPGFQRPRAVLEWIRQKSLPANLKRERVAEFVIQNQNNPKFADDIELLKPILAGAGIIYVVDGSKPYGKEFEAEMEILRECLAPSMAIINMIGDRDFSQDWKMALSNYFRIIRQFNPMQANFPQIISMLESMAHLEEEWIEPLKRATKELKSKRVRDIKKSAFYIANMIRDVMSYKLVVSIDDDETKSNKINEAKVKYLNDIANIEKKTLSNIALLFNRVDKDVSLEILDEIELFSKESISLFGLDKKSLLLLSASGGAIVGSSVDALLGGSSLFVGSLIGAGAGVYGALRGLDKAIGSKIVGNFIANKELSLGPIKDTEFPFILLKRALYFTIEIANRPHANRENIDIAKALKEIDDLDFATKKELQRVHQKFIKNRDSLKSVSEYSSILEEYLLKEIDI